MDSKQLWQFEQGKSGVLASGRWLWLRAILWALLLSTGTMVIFLGTQFLGPWLHLPANSSYVIVLLFPIAAFMLYGFGVQQGERRIATEVLPTPAMLPDLAVGALLGFLILCAMLGSLWALDLYRVEWHHWQRVFDAFLFDSYLSGMLEELMFRAILLRIVARAFGPMWGLGVSSILFGVAHLTHGTWLAALGITINAGLTMGLLYMATGRLWMSIGLHIGWDFTETSIMGVNNSDGLLMSTPMNGRSDILTGGSFGPDASILSLVLGVISIAVILYARHKGCFGNPGAIGTDAKEA